jgi:hypothetical protein
MDGRTLGQKFRIRGNLNLQFFSAFGPVMLVRQKIVDKLLNLVVRPYRDSRFDDHKAIALNVLGDLARNGRYVRQVRRPVRALRRADADEDCVGPAVRLNTVGGEADAAAFQVLLQKILQVFLINRNDPLL